MKSLNLFPITVFKFENPNPQTDRVISLIEKYNPSQKYGNWEEMTVKTTPGTLHLDPEFNFLIDWFHECLDKIKQYYILDCDKLDIAVCWGNKSVPGENAAHHIHTHNLSYMSAVYYITKGSPTVFLDPYYSKGGESIDILWKRNRDIEREIIPEPGSLILFPSWLPHCSRVHTGAKPRYTMSFNTLPVGDVNSGMYGFPMANIKLNCYEQRTESTENTSSISRGEESSN
jgi:uncharacterized protein (TIGR02466 family)